MPYALPRFDDVLNAAARIAPHARVTPVLNSSTLDALTGAKIFLKAEHLQCSGAFKFRGACNAVWALDDSQASAGVVTHSSGNHGGALALAAKTRGIACHVIVPEGAVASKVASIKRYGAVLHTCAPTIAARESLCAQVQASTGANLIHPYTNFDVITGQGTAALELVSEIDLLDAVVTPIGGGGLAAGTALSVSAKAPQAQLWLAEPDGAADAARSIAAGSLQLDFTPNTVCDGLRGTLGAPNLELLQQHQAKIATVTDTQTLAAMRLLWQVTKQTVEPSSAIALALVLANPEYFAGRRVGIILSGGNVDLDALPWVNA